MNDINVGPTKYQLNWSKNYGKKKMASALNVLQAQSAKLLN